MRLVRHYLRFEWTRWWKLPVVLWLACVPCVILAHRIQLATIRDQTVAALENMATLSLGFAVFSLVALCLLAGGADSPLTGSGWVMTRPTRRGPLLTARALLIFFTAVLPVAVTWGLMLSALDFDAATVIRQSLTAAGVLAALALMLVSWALIRLRPGMVLAGMIAAATAGVLLYVLIWNGSISYLLWILFPCPGIIFLLLAVVPPVAGLFFGAGRKGTPGRKAVAGIAGGMLVIAAFALGPVVKAMSEWLEAKELERMAFGGNGADWKLQVSGNVEARWFGPEQPRGYSLEVSLKNLGLPAAVQLDDTSVLAVASRNTPDGPWVEWPMYGGRLFAAGGVDRARRKITPPSWTLRLENGEDGITALRDGELRIKARVGLQRRETASLPIKGGAVFRGEGWNYKIVKVRGAGEVFSLIGRGWSVKADPPQSFLFSRQGRFVVPGDSVTGFLGDIGGLIHSRQVEYTNTPWISGGETPDLLSDEFLVTHLEPAVTVEKTILLSGVTFELPVRDDGSPRKERAPGWLPPVPAPQNPPKPWPATSYPPLPGPEASEAEVAVFLTLLLPAPMERESSVLPDWRAPENRARLAALVSRWLPLFLEMAVRYSNEDAPFIQSLIAGTPEERTEEVLRRLPDCPALVAVVRARGWEAEAKPFVSKAIEKYGDIPPELLPLCRSYQDPAFQPRPR